MLDLPRPAPELKPQKANNTMKLLLAAALLLVIPAAQAKVGDLDLDLGVWAQCGENENPTE